MKKKRQSWYERYADCPVDLRQAELWRQQTQCAPSPPQDGFGGEAAAPETAAAVGNPWIDNLPRRARRGHGGWIFFLLVAALLAAVGVYWAVMGLPSHSAPPDNGYGYEDLSADEADVAIPRVSGGDTRLEVRAEHGEALSAQEIYQKVNPAVVTVLAAHRDDSASLGTGVLFTEDGFFLTNAHVLEGASSCMILLADGRQYEANLVGYDREGDVAVLKALDAEGLPTAEIGDSNQLVEGDQVYAIGNPLGLELRGTLTDGIVSAINRDVEVDGRTMTLIQTNAAMNEGNSGGPLINVYGQVVGLTTVKMSAHAGETVIEGLGFAIPADTVAYLANQILAYGEARPTALGITVQAVEENGVQGLLVVEVTPGSCSDTAGIRAGDLILSADGRETRATSDLLAVRRSHVPGEEMTLTALRGGETLTFVVVLDEA